MKELFVRQYELVKSSRSALHEYCGRMSPEHFITPVPGFGKGSVRNLLVHITNTYRGWIAQHCFGRPVTFTEHDWVANMAECLSLYRDVDLLVDEFLDCFEHTFFTDITAKDITASPFKVFVHVTSHEFHHKGQILSISRILGYLPVDTDVIR